MGTDGTGKHLAAPRGIAGVAPRAVLAVADVCVFGFALWTIAANASYGLGRSLRFATILFAALCAVALLVRARCRPRAGEPAGQPLEPAPERGRRARLAVLAAAVAFGAAWAALSGTYHVFWIGAVAVLTASVALADGRAPAPFDYRAEADRAWGWWLALALCLAGVALATVAHHRNPDDCYYLERAAVLARGFTAPMPHNYTILPRPDLPWPYPSYPLVAFHDLIGLGCWLLDAEPLTIAACVVTPVAAALIVVAYVLLLRTVLPTFWPWALAALFSLLVIDGSSNTLFSTFAYIRIWQGKSILLHVAVPLLSAYALWFGSRGRRLDWLRLAATQVAMVGLSVMALWVAPFVACTCVLVSAPSLGKAVKRAVLAALAGAYPLAVGLLAYAQTSAAYAYRFEPPDVDQVLLDHFGSHPSAVVWCLALMLAPLLAPEERARRYLGLTTLIALLTLMNPMLADLVAKFVTSTPAYWRVLWAVPLPVVGASVLCLGFGSARRRRLAGTVVLLAVLTAYAVVVPTVYIYTSANSVRFGRPFLKVSRPEYEVVCMLRARLPEGSFILSPQGVGWMVHTFRKPLYSVAPRYNIVRHTLQNQLGLEEEADTLLAALDICEVRAPADAAILRRVVARYGVRAVVLPPNVGRRATAEGVLRGLGFTRYERGGYSVWLRPQGAAPPEGPHGGVIVVEQLGQPIRPGATGSDSWGVGMGAALREGDRVYVIYAGASEVNPEGSIRWLPHLAVSANAGRTWTKRGPILPMPEGKVLMTGESLLRDGGFHYLLYHTQAAGSGFDDAAGWSIGAARSPDMQHWEDLGEVLRSSDLGLAGALTNPSVLKAGGRYYMAVSQYLGPHRYGIRLLRSNHLLRGYEDLGMVIDPDRPQQPWYAYGAWDAELFAYGGRYWILFGGRDGEGPGRFRHYGLAVSARPDGPYEVMAKPFFTSDRDVGGRSGVYPNDDGTVTALVDLWVPEQTGTRIISLHLSLPEAEPPAAQ